MGIDRGFLLLFVWLSCALSVQSFPIACLQGTGLAGLEQANTIEVCPDGQTCYIRHYRNKLTSGLLIDVGCKTKEECRRTQCLAALHGGHISGNSTDSETICEECCYSGLCNARGCGLVADTRIRKCMKCDDITTGHYCLRWEYCSDISEMCMTSVSEVTSIKSTLGCSSRMFCQFIANITGGSSRTTCCDSDFCNKSPGSERFFSGTVTPLASCPMYQFSTTQVPLHPSTTTLTVTTKPPSVTIHSGAIGHSVTCFSGQGLRSLNEARRIEICQVDQACYIRHYQNNTASGLLIDVGCRSRQQCKRTECEKALNGVHASGSVSHGQTICEECCYSSLCNRNGCGLTINTLTRKCMKCDDFTNGQHCLNWDYCNDATDMCMTSLDPRLGHLSSSCSSRPFCQFISSQSDTAHSLTKCCDSDFCNKSPASEAFFNATVTPEAECPKDLISTTHAVMHTNKLTLMTHPAITTVRTSTARPFTITSRHTTAKSFTMPPTHTTAKSFTITSNEGGNHVCFSCSGMTHLKYCNTIDLCPDNRGCYVEQYHVGTHVRYNSGCLKANFRCNYTDHASGRCTSCCNSPYCNSIGCGDPGFDSKDSRGPICFECDHLGNPLECFNVQMCPPGEACDITEFPWGGNDRLYTMGCKPKDHCTTFTSQPVVGSFWTAPPPIVGRSTPICSRCCEEDFCNLNCTTSGIPLTG